jgi:hypothetical protein
LLLLFCCGKKGKDFSFVYSLYMFFSLKEGFTNIHGSGDRRYVEQRKTGQKKEEEGGRSGPRAKAGRLSQDPSSKIKTSAR